VGDAALFLFFPEPIPFECQKNFEELSDVQIHGIAVDFVSGVRKLRFFNTPQPSPESFSASSKIFRATRFAND
jgi:hypothetical protein